jgi:PTH1 family peptidyl-tRNA hydrolase
VKLVVGLGNPGPEYAETRHNAGLRAATRFADDVGISLIPDPRFAGLFGCGRHADTDVGVLLPTTFMNHSGDAVAPALEALVPLDPGDDLLLVYDDIDLPFAQLRMRRHGGSGGQRGVESVIERLGHDVFPRLRFGVGRPPPGVEPVDWVLSPFSSEECTALPTALEAASRAVADFVALGVDRAMNTTNLLLRSPAEEDPPA